jgi:hypothetical protein
MKHFTNEAWVDFVGGTVGKKEKSLMQHHLDDGCTECSKEAGLWQRVQATARRQNLATPPDGAVRIVKAMYAIHGPRSADRRKVAAAQLLFDSLLEPLPAGVRSAGTAPASRQLLFGLGDHRIDLRVEPEVDSEKVFLIGQILDSANPAEGLEGASVALLKGRTVLAEASTNRLGEFHLQCDLEGRVELRIKLPHGKEISVALVEPK